MVAQYAKYKSLSDKIENNDSDLENQEPIVVEVNSTFPEKCCNLSEGNLPPVELIVGAVVLVSCS